MIQITALREQTEEYIARLSKRGIPAEQMVHDILDLDRTVRECKQETENLQAESNRLAKEIGVLFREGKRDEADVLKARTSELKDALKDKEQELRTAEEALEQAMLNLPNAPHAGVPNGRSAEDNEVVYTWGTAAQFDFEAQPHWELAKRFNLIDFELGVKITGAGFPVYTGKGARLQRALINFFLDEARTEGFIEIQPPILVNEDSGYGTGQLPDKEGQMYHATADNLYLIPTAEVPITNIYRDVILDADALPIKNAGYTPCFRREAGSYGKDVRGLNRLHQFDKVEIVQIAHPDLSYAVLEEMQQYVQSLLQKLGLHYRVLKLCAGDMGFTSALTYDMEVYSAAQERWLEVSSVSNFESFQANRLKLRYRDENGKPRLAHTLNGSALALPRIVAALLENNQKADEIVMPEVLVPYLGFDRITL
ncbi:MAG: serine--tRNA ligase [Flavobacteriales bacterium]|nr:serine--tRNA ligase [Flavobacteriales bacterium]